MSEPLEFDWVDAFADRAFGGNGCAVVHDAKALPDETCLAFTKETGLVECTFLEPSEIADIKVRYFLATHEIPFAGHPTIASVVSLIDRGIFDAGALTLETGAGIIPIDVSKNGFVTMTQIAPSFGAELPKDLVAAVGGLNADDILAPPQVVSTGLPFCVTVLKDRASLDHATLDVAALNTLRVQSGDAMKDVMEPFWVTLDGATKAGKTYSRLLLPPPMPAEDPFTGSATGAMASYLWARGLIDDPKFVAEQGHGLGRPGSASVEVLGPRNAITGVRVGGSGHVLMRGTLHL